MYILGISAFYHDSAAAIVKNGEIIAAAQEERFTRKKADSNFPINAINFCLKTANITEDKLKAVVYYDKPITTFERLVSSYLHKAPFGYLSFSKAIPTWLKSKLWIEDTIQKALPKAKSILFSEHHISHAASAFFPSPFTSAAIITLDGVGEWDTSTIGIGLNNELKIIKNIKFPHSLGLFYSAFTYYCGFKVNSGEYKLMGLAPYGEAKYTDTIEKNIITISKDGSFILNQRYFNYISGLKMINRRFEKLFGKKALKQGANPTQFYMDIAASVQKVLEKVVVKIAKYAKSITNEKNLVLAGGTALNSVANYRVLNEAGFESLWIQPSAGDAGGSIGAALYASHALFGNNRQHLKNFSSATILNDGMKGSYLGPFYENKTIQKELDELGASYSLLQDSELTKKLASDLNDGLVCAWFQGKMEFGPRALGNRSILGDPRNPEMQKIMNLKIKFREGFRPFAPAVLAENASEWFMIDNTSPYMLFVFPVHKSKLLETTNNAKGFDRLQIKRSTIPAVTHVDNSARVQTVHKNTNPKFYSLLEEFYKLTACPVLINTSFNVRGEPIVCTPKEAYSCFLGTDIDVLVIGNYYLEKKHQNLDSKDSSLLLKKWKGSHVID